MLLLFADPIDKPRFPFSQGGEMFRLSKLAVCVFVFALFVVIATACGAPATQAPPPAAATAAPQPAAPTAAPAQPSAATKLKVWVEMSDNPKVFQDAFAQYA